MGKVSSPQHEASVVYAEEEDTDYCEERRSERKQYGSRVERLQVISSCPCLAWIVHYPSAVSLCVFLFLTAIGVENLSIHSLVPHGTQTAELIPITFQLLLFECPDCAGPQPNLVSIVDHVVCKWTPLAFASMTCMVWLNMV